MGNPIVRLIARCLDVLHIRIRTKNPFWRLAHRKGRLADALIEAPRPSARFTPPGFPIANTVDADNSPVGLDVVLMKGSPEFPQVEVPAVGIIAQQGIGKTFLANFLLFTSAFLDVGTYELNSRRRTRAHIGYDSFKVDKDGRPETSALIKDIFGCRVIDPTEVPFNYFSPAFGLSAMEQFKLTTDQIELWRSYSNKPPMSLAEGEVLRQLIDKMYVMKKRSFAILTKLAKAYKPESAEEDEEADGDDITVRYEEDLYKAAFSVYLSLNNFVKGTLGNLFAGNDDDLFARLIEQRAVSVHYRKLSDHERTHFELAMSVVRRTAYEMVETKKGPRRRFPNRIQHYVVQDEAYGSWTNLAFAREQYLRMKTQREFGTVLVTIFHQLTDMMDAISSAGSEQARLAMNSLNEINIWLVGRQKKRQRAILREHLGLSEEVLKSLPRLAKGHFWLIIPGLAPRLIWIRGTKTAIKYFNTEGATNELLQRYMETGDPETYQKWLELSSPLLESDAEEDPEVESETADAPLLTVA